MGQVMACMALVVLLCRESLTGAIEDAQDAVYGVVDIGLVCFQELVIPESCARMILEFGKDWHMDIRELLSEGHAISKRLALITKERNTSLRPRLDAGDIHMLQAILDTINSAIEASPAHINIACSKRLAFGLALTD